MGRYDVIILGAGAAGLMCAAQAGQLGHRVLVLERAREPGRKILISGGGRCNFTNIHATAERYLSANPHFAKSALAQYTAQDFLALIERHGIAWHEKTLGQLFCDGSARQIVDVLLAECARGQVEIVCGAEILEVSHAEGEFMVRASDVESCASALVIATGGPSIPKMGATGYAFELARSFGLKIVEPRPALVPLTLAGEDALFRDLSGVAAPVRVGNGKADFREAALFTHKGLSGPAILQISSYWRHGETIVADLLPDEAPGWLVAAKHAAPRTTVQAQLTARLPNRLAAVLSSRIAGDGALGNRTDAELTGIEQRIAAWPFRPNGSEGYAKAEVTAGGVSTAELSSKTMEARKVPGLYVIGEAVDVTGWLGGYNFQWAWSSGYVAAHAL